MKYRTPSQAGFTLVELVIAMSVATIVVAFMAMFITSPVHAYRSQVRRAELVDTADSVLTGIARDIRAALPNSVRVATNGNVTALEVLVTRDAARYRSADGAPNSAQTLDFTTLDTQFATIGCLDSSTTTRYLSIYNVGITGANAYDMQHVITPATTAIDIGACVNGATQIELSAPFRFAYESPQRRVYLVSGPVSYLCNTAARTLTRYSGYAIASAQPMNPSSFAGGTSALVATDVTGCTFSYTPGVGASAGTAERASLVTLEITVSRTDPTFSPQPEFVRLLHQVHVGNAP